METNVKLNFKPIKWGVEDFDWQSEKDKGISVTITRFASGGRESIDSNWKVYATHDSSEYWDVKAVCVSSDDRRYLPEDEVDFELYKDDKVWDVESRLIDELDNAGY